MKKSIIKLITPAFISTTILLLLINCGTPLAEVDSLSNYEFKLYVWEIDLTTEADENENIVEIDEPLTMWRHRKGVIVYFQYRTDWFLLVGRRWR